jgi:type IV pilus assembly protein PilO
MALEFRMEERKWSVALGVGLIFGVALAGAVHYAWLRGVNEEIRVKRTELAGLQQEIQKGRAAERKLAQFREEIKRLELDLSKLLQILPSKRNTEDLIKRIETLTRQGDFTLRKFTPGEFVSRDFYSEWPIDIQLEGTYHNLALFFDRMSRFSRIINVEEMKIGALNDPAGKSIGATFVAKTFIYTADEKGEAQGKKAGTARPAGGAAGKAQMLKKKSEAGMSE